MKIIFPTEYFSSSYHLATTSIKLMNIFAGNQRNMMILFFHSKRIPILFLWCILLFSCHPKKQIQGQVVIHELSNPDMLNPLLYADASAGYILLNIFPHLLGIDYKTLEIIPILATSRPEIKNRSDKKGLLITYQIRPEARFDNGMPITARDFEFTAKVVKNPRVTCPKFRPYYENIEDIILYDDPKKITFVFNENYILAEEASGDVFPLPSYIYDPLDLLKNFTYKQMLGNSDSLAANPKLIQFAAEFALEKYQRDSAFVSGSGPYTLSEWKTGDKIVLKRKLTWWGDDVKDPVEYFSAYPEKIIYQIINDQTTALVALKSGQLDVMRGIKSKDFIALPSSEKISKSYNLYSPTMFQYNYLGFNTRLPKFSDKQVRQALSQLVDVQKIIKTVNYNFSEQVIGPIHPSKVKSYNRTIKPYGFNPENAKLLLTEAGWKDTDGDGILDKITDGKKENFTLSLIINAGNDERKAIGLMFQEEARKVGVIVELVIQDRPVMLENMANHKFEMYFGGWIASPTLADYKQIFHSESYNGGTNYGGYASPACDALVDSMRVEFDEGKRNAMEMRFQEILHEEAPYIFLVAPKERLAISKKYSNAFPSSLRPGYRETGFMETAN